MRLVQSKRIATGFNFEGSKAGCVCSGTVAVANSHKTSKRQENFT